MSAVVRAVVYHDIIAGRICYRRAVEVERVSVRRLRNSSASAVSVADRAVAHHERAKVKRLCGQPAVGRGDIVLERSVRLVVPERIPERVNEHALGDRVADNLYSLSVVRSESPGVLGVVAGEVHLAGQRLIPALVHLDVRLVNDLQRVLPVSPRVYADVLLDVRLESGAAVKLEIDMTMLIRHEISVEEQNDIRSPEGDLKI